MYISQTYSGEYIYVYVLKMYIYICIYMHVCDAFIYTVNTNISGEIASDMYPV